MHGCCIAYRSNAEHRYESPFAEVEGGLGRQSRELMVARYLERPS